MNATAIKAMMSELAPVIREYVASEQADVRAENAALKAVNDDLAKRISALEAREMPSIDGLVNADTVRGMIADALPDVASEVQTLVERMDTMTEIAEQRGARLAAVEQREMPSLEGYVTIEVAEAFVSASVAAAIAEIPAPQDGKSIKPEEVQAMVNKAVAALPAPEKGDKGLGVKDLIIDREGELVATFDDGSTKALGRVVGKDAEPLPVDLKQLAGVVRVEVDKAVAALPAPEPVMVEPREVDMAAVREMVDELAQQAVSEQLPEAVKAIPVPEAPAPIEPDMEAIGKLIAAGIAKAVSELPPPEKGDPGIGLAGAMIDRDGNLIITTSDGRTHDLGLVVGKDGEPGVTFTLDDFDIEQGPDLRTFTFKFLNGNTMHSFEFEIPFPIHRGAWKEGHAYSQGDEVVWGGSTWVAMKATAAKPDTPDSGWMIAARKGRDGKSAS